MSVSWRQVALWPLLLAGSFPAFAADPENAPLSTIAVGDPVRPPIAPAPAVPDAQIETVIVTGELIDRPAERTTTSVSVKSGEEIERSTAHDVYDVIRETPNASFHDDTAGYGSFTLRGIGSYGAGAVQNIALYGAVTAVVFDGVGLPRSAMAYSDLSAFDLDQVEVFRGPQSTSQGRNAMAGAIIINSVEPKIEDSFHPEFRARFGAGSDDGWQGAAAFGATLWPDRVAVRIVTDQRGYDGDIDNVTRNDRNWGRDDSHGTRLRMKVTPFGADAPYEALISASDLRRYTGSRYLLQADQHDREATSDAPSDIDSSTRLYSLDQRLRLDETWTLRAVSAYARSRTDSQIDTDYSAAPDGTLDDRQNAHSFSQEIRASFHDGDWRGSFGAYYYRGSDGDQYQSLTSVKSFADAFGLCAVPLVCELPLGNVRVEGAAPARIEDMAAFGEVDWQILPRLTLTAGLRADREENSRRIVSEIDGDTPQSTVIVGLLQAAGALGENGTFDVGRTFTAWLPKLAASYEFVDGWYAGLAYSEGYRPGGDGYNYASGRRYRFDEERTRNYEASLKGRYVPWRTQLALNLFHTDWDDMQTLVGSGFDTYVDNAGRSRIDGGELELTVAAFDTLRVIGGVGITDGKFVDFVSSVGDYSGNPLPKAPKYSATLALEWQPWRGVLLRPDVAFTGSTPAQPDDGPTHQLEHYALLNLSARWQINDFTFFFSGSNLTDKNYRTDAQTYGVSYSEVAALGIGRRLIGGFEFAF